MAQYTENYHLSKPDPTDTQSSFISDYCSNMDKIDQNMGGGGSSVSWQQLQVTGDKIATIRISGINTDVYSPNSQTFSMAISRANINSDEKYSTIFGKIKKWFADLKTVAFTANASDLTNDAGFITNTVNNLANYYLKSETYTQAEVNALIGAITTIHFEVVQTLPTSDIQTNVIYLVPKSTAGTNDVYDEYINTTGTSAGWELIGSTQVDLSNYYTKTQTDTLLAGKVSSITVTQIQSAGTKIATIDVDGTSTDLYAPNGGASALDDLTDVNMTSPSNGQVLKYDASNNEWVNSNEGAVEIIPNPVDPPTAQLNSLGFYGTNVVTVLDNGLVSTSSAYAWASYRTTLVTGVTYDLKLTDSFYPNNPIYSSFTWQGSTIVLTLGDRKELTIEETRAGLTYFPGAWRQHYLDIKSQIQSTIYKVGNVSDNPTFTEAQTRANIASGESFATILGKIKKFFTDLKAVAFSGSYNDLSDKPTIPDISTKVSKSGDTMSGTLTVQTSSQTPIRNKTTASNAVCYLNFANGDGDLGWFAVGNDRKPYFQSANDGTLKEIPMDVIKKGEWWTSGTSHNANDLRGEVVFAYNEASQQNVATTGTLVSFACRKNNYPFQLQSAYTYDALYYRRQNGDNSTWGNWREIIHSGNIGNQSVSYANTAGSAPANGGNADTVDNYHFFAEKYKQTVEVNQPTANQSWGVVIKTGDWDSDSQVVQIRCTGSNVSSTAVIYLVSRSKKIWGYNTYYNTAGIQGVVVTVSNSTDLHVCLFSDVTKIKIYKSWSGGSVATESLRSDYIDTTEASFFAYKPTLTDIKSLGTLTAKAIVVDNVLQIREPVNDNVVNLRKPNAVTATRNITLPNKDGTVALTSDISSRRYKENIIPLSEDEAKKILDVEIVNYDYKENVVDEDERYDQKGAIAEDVVNLIPNAVTYADIDGEQLPDGINYTKFIPYLIKMVQMQQKEIEELKAMIKEK